MTAPVFPTSSNGVRPLASPRFLSISLIGQTHSVACFSPPFRQDGPTCPIKEIAQMVATAISPLAPAAFPDLPAIAGVKLHTATLGIRYKGRPDVLLAELEPGTQVAGVFTKSTTASAAVRWGREALKGGTARAFSSMRGTRSPLPERLAKSSSPTRSTPRPRHLAAPRPRFSLHQPV